jgi:hypothetical protein
MLGETGIPASNQLFSHRTTTGPLCCCTRSSSNPSLPKDHHHATLLNSSIKQVNCVGGPRDHPYKRFQETIKTVDWTFPGRIFFIFRKYASSMFNNGFCAIPPRVCSIMDFVLSRSACIQNGSPHQTQPLAARVTPAARPTLAT